MAPMFRSATFKLTMWYLAIVMALSLSFSIVIYHFAIGELTVGLHNQTLRIYRNFPVFEGSPLLRPGNDLEVGTHHILMRLVYFNFVLVFLAGIASYFLARRTLQPIEQAHERQKRFTADVSHELRTPLTSLRMGTEVALLDDNATKQELRDALGSNLEDIGKMEQLINNLLRLTRLDAEAMQASFQPLMSKKLIAHAVKQVANQAEMKKVAVKVSGKDLPIFGDGDSLTQLLVILLDNAIKYSPTGSTVTIDASKANNLTKVVVTDKGQGIPATDLPHIFDRFYRADSSRTKLEANDGYGLGLSIAKLIADNHQGTITLTSRSGHGTTASVVLPAETIEAQL